MAAIIKEVKEGFEFECIECSFTSFKISEEQIMRMAQWHVSETCLASIAKQIPAWKQETPIK